MTEQERKDAEAVKMALNCGIKDWSCTVCTYQRHVACKTILIQDLAGVIDRKDKRIEELEERIAIMTEGVKE